MRWDMVKIIVERPRIGRHHAPKRGRAGWALLRQLELQHGRDGVYAAHKQQLGKRALARLLPEVKR